jgi:hypothetical protein
MGLSKTSIITGPDLRQADRLLDPILCRHGGGTVMIRGLLHLVVEVAETLALNGLANGALDERTIGSSAGFTKLMAWPTASTRAVRPARCTYVSTVSGMS